MPKKQVFCTLTKIMYKILARCFNLVYICTIIKNKAMKNAQNKQMTFTEVLESEYKYLVEQIEHGRSDVFLLQNIKKELLEKTGYKWIG